jgi:alpha-L-rhamnosidase
MKNFTCRRVLIDHAPFLNLDAKRGWIDQGIWPASWITHPSLPVAPCGMEFRLKLKNPGSQSLNLRLHATGDERYELSIDDELIGWGSERGMIDHWYFDSYDLSLDAGESWLIARVWAAGPCALRSQMSAGPGFLLASETAGFSTGEAQWEVRLLEGLRYEKPFDHDFFSVGWNTVHDASQMNPAAVADLSEVWKPAHPLEPGSTDGRRNRYPHIRLLAPAVLPVTRREFFRGGRVRHISSRLTGPIINADHLISETPGWERWWLSWESVTFPSNKERRLLIDLEDYVCAWPQLEVSGGHGAHLTVRWAESLYEQEGIGRKGDRGALEGKVFTGIGDTFLPDGSEHAFRGPFIRAGRYLQLTLRTGAEPLILKSLRLIRAEYPLEITAKFSTDLAPMQPLLDRCVRTVRASCHDNLIDGPYYEQMGWIGDTPQVALTLYSMSHDVRIVRKVLEVFDRSRLPSGMIRARWPARDSLFLPPYALCWINVLHDFAWWRNEPDFVRARLPGMRAILDGFLSWVDPKDGLLRIPTGWNFTDWVHGWAGGIPPLDADGSCGVFQWQLAWAFQQAAVLEDHFGETELAGRWRRHAQRIALAAEVFWDDTRNLYADNRTRISFCEHAQAYAALSGLIPSIHLSPFKTALVTDRNYTRATDPFSHYVLEAYGRLDLREHIWPRLKGWFEYDTLGLLTTPEGPEPTRSDCHAWGAHPHYHLFASLFGLRPATPGFSSVRIDPMWTLLQNVSGEIPHPDGDICFRVSLVAGRPDGEVSLPRGISGTINYPGGQLSLHEGINRFGRRSA